MFPQVEWEESQVEVFMFISSAFETIKFEVKNDLGYLIINREEKLNALNSTVLSELKELFEALHNKIKEEKVRGLILTGSGDKAFIAGADISEMKDMNKEQARKFGELGQQVTLMMESLPIPIIACVNGYALGGGTEIAMACDFIFAQESAVFGQPEVKLGLIPGFGGTQRLAKLIGRGRAKEIIYTGRNVSAEEAKRIGLVIEVFKDKEEMLLGAKKTFSKIMKVGSNAVGNSKKVMNVANDLTIKEGLNAELSSFIDLFGSEEMREGTTAFLEKRPPNF